MEKQIRTVTLRCDKHGIEYPAQEYTLQIFGHKNETRLHAGDCPTCEAEREAEQADIERRKRAEKKERAIARSRIEPMYRDATLASFDAYTPELVTARDAVADLVSRKTGLLVLFGANGTGKTHLACAAVQELGGKIWTMYEISLRIRASYSLQATESELGILGELASLPMLAIDEVGRTKGSTADANWLSYIVDRRYAQFLPLILATNKHARRKCMSGGCVDCLENYIGEDIMSRLDDGGRTVQIVARDFRAKKLRRKSSVPRLLPRSKHRKVSC